jgi:hypothetical protein
MLDDLAPLGLVEAARRLGTSPFELVRVAVAHGEMPPGVARFDAARMQRLAATGAFGSPSPEPAAARSKPVAEQPR